MPPALAVAGIGAAAGIGGSLIQSSAAKSAANAQERAAQQATAEQQRQFDLTRSDNAPWLAAGQQALGGQLNLLGLNGADPQSAAIGGIQASPLFRSLDRVGTEALLANASATGGLRGGNTQSALYNNRADLLAQIIQQQFSNLGGLSGAGNQTAANLGQLGQQSSDNISSLLLANGGYQAANSLSQGRIGANALNGLSSSLSSLFALNKGNSPMSSSNLGGDIVVNRGGGFF